MRQVPECFSVQDELVEMQALFYLSVHQWWGWPFGLVQKTTEGALQNIHISLGGQFEGNRSLAMYQLNVFTLTLTGFLLGPWTCEPARFLLASWHLHFCQKTTVKLPIMNSLRNKKVTIFCIWLSSPSKMLMHFTSANKNLRRGFPAVCLSLLSMPTAFSLYYLASVHSEFSTRKMFRKGTSSDREELVCWPVFRKLVL